MAALLLALPLLGSCEAHSVRRFALAAPLWQDPDRNPVPRQPTELLSSLYAEGMDESILRPAIDPLALPVWGESANVNAVDEVPHSSWFVDRIGSRPMSPEEAARGPCTSADLEGLRGPWEVTSTKEEGATPGFVVKAPGGQRYLFKIDDDNQPTRNSAAEAIASKFYYAIGYHVPCNQVARFRPEQVRLGRGATFKNDRGQVRPLTQQRLDAILGGGFRFRDGRLRAAASRLVEGEPLGPHPVRGVRRDDPNDVIPHEDRRELRAERLLAAWMGRFDAREQNSMDSWVAEGGRRYVRHYQLDFGECFGGEWRNRIRLNRNTGHQYYVDLGQILTDLFTLGALHRPWYGPRPRPGGATFGYFGWQDFRPSEWKPIVPHPPFRRMTWRDALWMVRRIGRLSDAHVRAIVREGQLSPADESYLALALCKRRDRIAAEYLRRHVPLAEPAIMPRGSAPSICFADLGVRHAGVDPSQVVYRISLLGGEQLDRVLGMTWRRPDPRRPDWTCARLPFARSRPSAVVPPGTPDADPRRYVVAEIEVLRPSTPPGQLRLHFYDLGPQRGLVTVGLERL